MAGTWRWLAAAAVLVLASCGSPAAADANSHYYKPDCAMTTEQHTELQHAAANLTDCILQYVSPTHFCARCQKEKERMAKAYSMLSGDCQRFKQIRSLHESILGNQGLWSAAHCDDCSVIEMTQFSTQLCHFYKCLNNTFPCNDAVDPIDFFRHSGVERNRSVCRACHVQFKQVEKLHDSFSADCGSNSDVIDSFRRLLDIWTQSDCTVYNVSAGFVYVIVLCTLFFPVAFYWLAYLFTRNASNNPVTELSKRFSVAMPPSPEPLIPNATPARRTSSVTSTPAALQIPAARSFSHEDISPDERDIRFHISSRTSSVRDYDPLPGSLLGAGTRGQSVGPSPNMTRRRRRLISEQDDGDDLLAHTHSVPAWSPARPTSMRKSQSMDELEPMYPPDSLASSLSGSEQGELMHNNTTSPLPDAQPGQDRWAGAGRPTGHTIN